jgi:hypothetical protein
LPAGLGGVSGTITSLYLFSELDSYRGSIPGTLLFFVRSYSSSLSPWNALAEAGAHLIGVPLVACLV